MKTMKKTFDFGKIDWYGRGRKVNAVTVDVRFEDEAKGPTFSICADVWNARRTDIVAGGQILDELGKFKFLGGNELFRKIRRLWRLHHCNDMNSASPAQEKLIEKWKNAGNRYDYDAVCKMLEKNNMLEDPTYLVDGKPYRYGSKWLYRSIPKKDLDEIKEILLA